jgi:hypothetical protein
VLDDGEQITIDQERSKIGGKGAIGDLIAIANRLSQT